MIDKLQKRLLIVDFFKNRKTNKNSYFRKWYENQNHGEIYDYINEYYDYNHPLYTVPLSQKLYHIINDIVEIPNIKFLNLKTGYKKEKPSFSGKSITHFIERVSKISPETTEIINLEQLSIQLDKFIKKSAYTALLKDKSIINNILRHTTHIDDIRYKFAFIHNDNKIYCSCGNLRKFINDSTFKLCQTCGSNSCVSSALSISTKSRDLSYLQTENVKHKRINSRSWYSHSDETKAKISISNKKTWTYSKRRDLLDKNKQNGVYIRAGNVLRQKIKDGIFTPRTTNRLNHKRLVSPITGITTYRSSWEVLFHEKNPNLLYEYTRVNYTYEGRERVYIVDFTDCDNRILYEVKPASMINDAMTQSKLNGALIWCEEHGYTFQFITENEI